jgi:hypothetical protein
MNQPSIFQLPLWGNYKRNIFIVIRSALLILLQEQNLPKIEDSTTQHSLNRHLAKNCFKKAVYQNQLPNHMPTYNGENPPYKDDIERHPRENKKPDFYWRLIDHTAEEVSCERNFILECKRLGQSNRSWPLNENYIKEGIRRFIVGPHEYGKGDDACGMIGYVQSMDFDEILQEINYVISQNPEPISLLPMPVNGWQEKGISELEHDLERPFPDSPFRMYHFWVDLRSNY